jgi:hypothetical protein
MPPRAVSPPTASIRTWTAESVTAVPATTPARSPSTSDTGRESAARHPPRRGDRRHPRTTWTSTTSHSVSKSGKLTTVTANGGLRGSTVTDC